MEIATVTVKSNAVAYKSKEINGVNIFYREAGNPSNETLVLLHGFPTSSHMYREVLSSLSDEYYLIAPDYPGFGDSDFPSPKEFNYTFDNLASYIDLLLEELALDTYTLMIQDYGAPIGFRIATAHPERVKAIITQNGNAYEEGLNEGTWAGIKALWGERSPENEEALLGIYALEGLKWQYVHGTRNPEVINPDNWNLDFSKMQRPEAHRANLDLFYDYQSNVKLYPTWQKYLRDNQPPLLVVWGKNDPFFPEPGAEAYKKDVKEIDYNIFDTGHFALEEDGQEIISKIRAFLARLK